MPIFTKLGFRSPIFNKIGISDANRDLDWDFGSWSRGKSEDLRDVAGRDRESSGREDFGTSQAGTDPRIEFRDVANVRHLDGLTVRKRPKVWIRPPLG